MEKSRLEVISDGVIAIILTIMVRETHLHLAKCIEMHGTVDQ